MRVSTAWKVAVVLCVLATTPARAMCGESPLADDDLNTLLDPQADAGHKAAASRRLADRAATGALGKNRDAPASADRSRRLGDILTGPAIDNGHPQLMPDNPTSPAFPPTDPVADDWRQATLNWKAAAAVQVYLRGWISADRQRAIQSLAALAVAEPTRLRALDDQLKARLVADLEAFDRVEPSMRRHTLGLVVQLGPNRAAAVPLVLRALADDDPAVQRRAQRISITLHAPAEDQSIMNALAIGLNRMSAQWARATAGLDTACGCSPCHSRTCRMEPAINSAGLSSVT